MAFLLFWISFLVLLNHLIFLQFQLYLRLVSNYLKLKDIWKCSNWAYLTWRWCLTSSHEFEDTFYDIPLYWWHQETTICQIHSSQCLFQCNYLKNGLVVFNQLVPGTDDKLASSQIKPFEDKLEEIGWFLYFASRVHVWVTPPSVLGGNVAQTPSSSKMLLINHRCPPVTAASRPIYIVRSVVSLFLSLLPHCYNIPGWHTPYLSLLPPLSLFLHWQNTPGSRNFALNSLPFI